MTAFLKAEKLLVVLASDPNLFQSFAPLNEKLFCHIVEKEQSFSVSGPLVRI